MHLMKVSPLFLWILLCFMKKIMSSNEIIYLDQNQTIKVNENGTLLKTFQKFSCIDQLIFSGTSFIKIMGDYIFQNSSDSIILGDLNQNLES